MVARTHAEWIAGAFEVLGAPARKPGYLEFLNPRLRPARFDPDLHYVSLDIETDGIDGQILSIALSHQQQHAVLMQGRTEDWPSALPIRWFGDEGSLLQGFLECFRVLDPDLILGWNLINFDLHTIERRCGAHRIAFALGRRGEVARILTSQRGGQAMVANIPGRVALDGIDKALQHQIEFASDVAAQGPHQDLHDR